MNTHSQKFLLGSGGLLYQIYLKTGLLKDPLLLVKRRILVLILLTWAPLLILSLITKQAFNGVRVPFFYDMDVQIRFLISLPLLIYAEITINETLARIVDQFKNSDLIPNHQLEKFNQSIASAMNFTKSYLAEILILIFVIAAGFWISRSFFPLAANSWLEVNHKLSPAGYWYKFVSLPIFQFILLRWFLRIGVWYHFLWKTAGRQLSLNYLHPDKAGGIAFLGTSLFAFSPILIANASLLAAIIYNYIWNEGATLGQYQIEILIDIFLLILVPIFPLLFFSIHLIKVKQAGIFQYNTIASRYVKEFTSKWITNKSDEKSILGTPDLQSLADLANSYQTPSQMSLIPVNKSIIISVIILIAFPFFILFTTTIPLEKIIFQFIGFIIK